MKYRNLLAALALAGMFLPAIFASLTPIQAEGLDPQIQDSEARRIAIIEKVRPAVVAIFISSSNGGSGVLISEDGYALTNNHVAGPTGGVMKCGLPDGELYDAVVVGLDQVGDVALVKLLPKKEGAKFPFVKMADSDKVRPGDWSLAMGNPFLLATDFTPTVTFGIVSGVHRSGHYVRDCLQVDTSINPGNSGGPLFNMDGELIGINGAISLDKRGRVNIGVGHAISINQIKNSLGHLRAGLIVDHASLGVLFKSESEEGELSKVAVSNIIPSDASRRGLEVGDQLLSFDGKPIRTVNQFESLLGTYPKGWRLPLVYHRENDKVTERREVLVRLMGVTQQALPGPDGQPPQEKQPQEQRPQPSAKDSPAKKFFKPKPGYANYYFNKLERDRLLAAFKKQAGDFTTVQGDWKFKANGVVNGKQAAVSFSILDKGAKDGKSPLIQSNIDGVDYSLEPLEVSQTSNALRDPPGSGGLLLAMYHYHQFLALGEKGGFRDIDHGGIDPFYPPLQGKDKSGYAALRVDAEVLHSELAGIPVKWYFSPKDATLLGFELTTDREMDPCEVYFSNYHTVDGRALPSTIEVRYGDNQYARLEVSDYKLEAAK